MIVLKIIAIALLSVPVLVLLLSPIYFKFGLGKWLYHNIFGWHQPKSKECETFDGCSVHNVCKHCGKEIMQDSQGNWF